MSNSAEIDSKPELLVDADDVKAAHGATVSQLDENEVFYFQTRGIKKDTAESMLSKGFVDEVIFKEKNLQLKTPKKRWLMFFQTCRTFMLQIRIQST